MKALIMAAGVGSRISRHLHDRPKCCVDVGGKPLIRYTFELLRKMGIVDIAIVTGYQESYIVQALDGLKYTRYFNPFYRITNSIVSAWRAQDFLSGIDDVVVMNGDVFVEERVLQRILNDSRSPVMFADSSRIREADYRFQWRDERLLKYGKELKDEETSGEYVGIGKIKGKELWEFKQRVIDYVNKEDYHCWWEDAIYRRLGEEKPVYVEDLAGLFWAEVDFIEDYHRIQEFVQNRLADHPE